MKPLVVMVLLLSMCISGFSQSSKAPTSLRSILLEQLKSTHTAKEWFVPLNIAIAGLTPEQANWKDSSGNHSIAQLATHLLFWNQLVLKNLYASNKTTFDGNNQETFSPVTEGTWSATIKSIDSVFTALETAVQNATDQQLESWASKIAHISTHNAYHIGQILYIRKMKEWWNDDNGVK